MKYDKTSKLFDDTIKKITLDQSNWCRFLETSGKVYKYKFEDQVLIHAQKPDAYALASYDLWNKAMGRYIKAESNGVALLNRESERLNYIFDYRDTGAANSNSRTFEPWSIDTEEQNSLALLMSSGKFSDLKSAVNYSIIKLVDEQLDEYIELLNVKDTDSELLSYDDINKREIIRSSVTDSVMYAVHTRMGLSINNQDYDFSNIYSFDTFASLCVSGNAGNTSKSLQGDRSRSEHFSSEATAGDEKSGAEWHRQEQGVYALHSNTGEHRSADEGNSNEGSDLQGLTDYSQISLFDSVEKQIENIAKAEDEKSAAFFDAKIETENPDQIDDVHFEIDGNWFVVEKTSESGTSPNGFRPIGYIYADRTYHCYDRSLSSDVQQKIKDYAELTDHPMFKIPPQTPEVKLEAIKNYKEPFVVIKWSESLRFNDDEKLTFNEADKKFQAVKYLERLEGSGGYNKTSGIIHYLDGLDDKELSTYEFRYDIGDYSLRESGLYNHINGFWDSAEKISNNPKEYSMYSKENIKIAKRMLKILEPYRFDISREVLPAIETTKIPALHQGKLDYTEDSFVFESFSNLDESHENYLENAELDAEEGYSFIDGVVNNVKPNKDHQKHEEQNKSDYVRERETEEQKTEENNKALSAANYIITDDLLGVGGQKTKFNYNIAAITLLKTLESKNRQANSEEQEILSWL